MLQQTRVETVLNAYETFVSRMELNKHPDQPEWLSHVNASVLKIKLAMAIIGISSISLLRTFIEAGNLGTSRGNATAQILPLLGVMPADGNRAHPAPVTIETGGKHL